MGSQLHYAELVRIKHKQKENTKIRIKYRPHRRMTI